MTTFKKSLFLSCFLLTSSAAFAMQGGANWDDSGGSGGTKTHSYKFGFSIEVAKSDDVKVIQRVVGEKLSALSDRKELYAHHPAFTMLGFEATLNKELAQFIDSSKLHNLYKQRYEEEKQLLNKKLSEKVNESPAGWTLEGSWAFGENVVLTFHNEASIMRALKEPTDEARKFLNMRQSQKSKDTWKEIKLLPLEVGITVACVTPEDRARTLANSLNQYLETEKKKNGKIYRIGFTDSSSFGELPESPFYNFSASAPQRMTTRQKFALPLSTGLADQPDPNFQENLMQLLRLAAEQYTLQQQLNLSPIVITPQPAQQSTRRILTRRVSAALGSAPQVDFGSVASLATSSVPPVASSAGKGKRISSTPPKISDGKRIKQEEAMTLTIEDTTSTSSIVKEKLKQSLLQKKARSVASTNESGFIRTNTRTAVKAPRPRLSVVMASKPTAAVAPSLGKRVKEERLSPDTPKLVVNLDVNTLSPDAIKMPVKGKKPSANYVPPVDSSSDESSDNSSTRYEAVEPVVTATGKPARHMFSIRHVPGKQREKAQARFQRPSGKGMAEKKI